MLILMNPGMVRPLLDTTTSETEKALSRFNFAKTVSLPRRADYYAPPDISAELGIAGA